MTASEVATIVIPPFIKPDPGHFGSFAYDFVDDLLVVSKNETMHLEHLLFWGSKLSEYGLSSNIEKCQFGKSIIELLGLKLSPQGI
ncbi:hypothetical protein NPIL_321541 [Nephila pilipes]|uniref:Reverse transcriptase domain-containing protein n=1 Tax=Nephila pilipes TaxID=299642 RepID=A0A8X6NRF8_NEPPI|nr:hypothetical protein NPIL_321541 [Nephila pilipes]